MPICEPRKVKVFMDGSLFREFRSVQGSVKFFMQYSGISSYANAKFRVNNACKKNGYILNLRFVKDQNYIASRPVFAINQVTGDYIIKPSVGKMGEHIFGKHDGCATQKISYFCNSGRVHRTTGLVFKYIENGYVFSQNYHKCGQGKAIFQLDRETNVVMNVFNTVTCAARHIFNLGISRSSVRTIATSISSCASGNSLAAKSSHGFKWCYVRNDVPLPEPDAEGL